jgi:peptidoglycan-associated lipoprotein
MMKKIGIMLGALAFAFSSLVFMASCAKKQIKVEEPVAMEEKEEAKEIEVKSDYDEEYERREAERQARLREMERAQTLDSQMRAFESESIYFDFDKAELKPGAQAALKKKADWLWANPQYSVSIEGHCDERGTDEYNLALGDRRAHAARKFLMALGISGERLSTISYGEESPADPAHSEGAWAKNRRDEFRLIK